MAVGVPLKLSETTPDFESLVLQLQLFLESKGSWADVLPSSLGQTLIEMMAAVGSFNQFAIESAAREAFLITAKRQSSIYAITRMLGVRVSRKSPASVSVQLNRTDTTVQQILPRFTRFKIEDKMFFNRDTIVFPAGIASIGQTNLYDDTTPQVLLYEGEVKVKKFAANTTSFREIYLDELNFSVSDQDVLVKVLNNPLKVNEEWTKTRSGNAIWTADPGEKVYYDNTSGYGDTVLMFGDGVRGALPPLGSDIEVTYAITKGLAGDYGVSGQSVSAVNTDIQITGSTISIINGGSDEKSALFYKSMAPFIFKARSRAVTAPDYKAICMAYPGIASASISAQRSSALRANTPQWMNVVQICLLPDKPLPESQIVGVQDYKLSAAQQNDFLEYLQEFQHVAIYPELKDAYKILVDLEVTVFINKSAVPSNVLPVVAQNIRALFARTHLTLGRKIAMSDVVDAALTPDVDYVDINVMKYSSSLGITAQDLTPIDPTYTDLTASNHLKSSSAFLELNDTPETFRINTQYSER